MKNCGHLKKINNDKNFEKVKFGRFNKIKD